MRLTAIWQIQCWDLVFVAADDVTKTRLYRCRWCGGDLKISVR